LNIRNADIFRGTNKVLEHLNLEVESGASTAVIGPNGAGKTTLLKVLAREIYPAAGSVKIYGKERWNVWDLRKRLGIVSSDLQQNYSPTACGFSVVISGFYSSVDTFGHQSFSSEQLETARIVSRELEIDQLSETPFSQMSTGEQRRHLLARALVNNPSTLVLDEPTAGLDLAAQHRYMNRIQQLIRKGKTIVLVTHHVHEIPPEIENIVLLKDGKVIQSGPKVSTLTSQNLSRLFDVPLIVVSENGFYQVVPGVKQDLPSDK
jgi:iron complex transport system ATP-binding protein